jgi:hypothetical protein
MLILAVLFAAVMVVLGQETEAKMRGSHKKAVDNGDWDGDY